jgi:syringomycin synthetase protein SyrE
MIPSAFVVLPALPLNANGKLDRAALPAPAHEHLAAQPYEAPQGPTETTIAQLWQQLLGVDRVGRFDRFFDLGGHSLLVVQVLSRVRRALGVRIQLREFFAEPTVAGLAELVSRSEKAALPSIPVADRDRSLPLSFAQQRLWFLDQFDRSAGAAYHIPHALRLHGDLDRAALRATLDRIVQRHENLRTTFVAVDGTPLQRIAPPDTGFHLVEQDLRGMPEDERAATLASLGDHEAHAPFDLSDGPLIRGRLLQLAETDHVLLVTLHHIVSDAWSSGVLMREVSQLYAAFVRGEPDPLPPLALQYADYAAWQRQWLQGEALQEQARFWKAHLAGAPALLDLPTDHARPSVQTYAGGTIGFELPVALGARLQEWSKQQDVTLFMALLAGWSILLASLSGQDDIVVGTPVANRQRPELEPIIGFFVNTLALRVQLKAQPSVAQLLQQVKATSLAAYGHQDLPFEQVVEILQPPRSLGHSPIFQVMMSLDNTPPAQLELAGLRLDGLQQAHATTQFDLSLALAERDGAVRGSMQYASDLFELSTVERIAEQYKAVLAAMTADAQQPVHALMAALPAFPRSGRQALPAPGTAATARPPYEAPRDGLESTIAELWEELLEQAPIGRHDDFFALGGISLMAVRMVTRLRKLAGRSISIRELFAHPTVAGLAGVLAHADGAASPHPNLVPIRPAGRQRPLFLLHPIGGEVQYAHAVAPWLGDEHPVYGLAAPGAESLAGMDELVDSHLRAIRHVQPQGPYRLAGWSAGGLIAYEIAGRLRAEHQEVEFIGMIDAAARTAPQPAPTEVEFLLSWLPAGTPPETLARLRMLGEHGDIEAMLGLCRAEALLPRELPHDLDADLLRRHFTVAYAIGRIVASRGTRRIPGEVWLFSAKDEPRTDPSLGWAALLGAHLHQIPLAGTHLSLVERPHVEALGAALAAALASASASHASTGNRADRALAAN